MDKEQLMKYKNKDFAFSCIKILVSQGRKTDLEKLTNPAFCKTKFDMNYAILQEVPGENFSDVSYYFDNNGNRRYYPEIMELFGKHYILCNDWYYGKNRDTRSDFVRWVLSRPAS